VTIPCCSPC